MFNRYTIKRGNKDEGERPFWISFSDLMTALMSLFLVVMSVTLLSVTKKIDQEEQRKVQREADISSLMQMIRDKSKLWKNVQVDENTYRINLPEEVNFDRGSASISPEGQRFLRSYVPTLLNVYNSALGKRWIRRIVVEGFTDQDGSYLYNLGLSLDRSRNVVCALYEEPNTLLTPSEPRLMLQGSTDNPPYSPPMSGIDAERPLTQTEKELIRQLFLVGGYSFNSMKASKEESRRVEFKLEFWALDETQPVLPDLSGKEFGKCL